MNSPRPALGAAMIVLATTASAINSTVSKLLQQGGFTALQLTTLRAFGGFAVLLAATLVVARRRTATLVVARRRTATLTVARRRTGKHPLRVSRAELPALIAFGLTGVFFVPVCYFIAISRLPVGIGLLLEYTAPAFVALWIRFGQHQQVRRRLWLGLALCLAGLACVTQVWSGQLRLDPIGMIAGVASAVLLASYYLLGSKTVASRDPLSLTCLAFGVAAVLGVLVSPRLPLHLLARDSVNGAPMSMLALYFVTFGTVVPYLLFSMSMRHLPPTSVGIIAMVEIVLASAIAWVLLDESLATVQILGGLVLLAGVVLAETARTPAIPPPT